MADSPCGKRKAQDDQSDGSIHKLRAGEYYRPLYCFESDDSDEVTPEIEARFQEMYVLIMEDFCHMAIERMAGYEAQGKAMMNETILLKELLFRLGLAYAHSKSNMKAYNRIRAGFEHLLCRKIERSRDEVEKGAMKEGKFLTECRVLQHERNFFSEVLPKQMLQELGTM